MTPKYDLTVSPDGESITITVPCDPLTVDHEVTILTLELREAVTVARSRQLGVDSWGDL